MWHGPMQGPSMPGSWLGWGMGMGVLMLLFWLLVIAGIVFLIWFLVSAARGAAPTQASQPVETPLDLLKKRYAKGEITEDQFQQMKRNLEA